MHLRVAPIIFLIACQSQPESVSGQDSGPVLVTPSWVAQRPDTRLLDVRDAEAYRAGHLPHAIQVDSDAFHRFFQRSGLPMELTANDSVQAVIRDLGIDDDSRVVVYGDGESATVASRMFFNLEYAGLRGRVHLLDGGIDAWVAAGHATDAEPVTVTTGDFVIRPDSSIIATQADVVANGGDSGFRLVDARSPAAYQGQQAAYGRGGHIPDAVSLPHRSVLAPGTYTMLPRAELISLFTEAGAHAADTIVSYCWIGQVATMVYVGARAAGFDAKVYDGSWSEWAQTERPIEN